MVKVSIIPTDDGVIFECEGHAGYAPPGEDIVCAGISALCLALLHKTEELCDEGEASILTENIADGYVGMEVNSCGGAWSALKLRTVFDTVRKGMEAIERLYPEFVRVD